MNPKIRASRVEAEGEWILLVEEDAALGRAGAQGLRRAGYVVLQAATGEEAIRLFEHAAGRVDLVITEVLLPGMSGAELVHSFRKYEPTPRFLFVSGCSDDRIRPHLELHPEIAFLRKPCAPVALARAVRRVLDQRETIEPGGENSAPGPKPFLAASAPFSSPAPARGLPDISGAPGAPRPSRLPRGLS